MAAADAAVNDVGELGVERRHHLRQRLHDGGCDAAVDQVLGHFEADEAAPDHDGGPGAGDRSDHVVGVLDRAQRQGTLDAGDRRPDGACARREDEGVVGEDILGPAGRGRER